MFICVLFGFDLIGKAASDSLGTENIKFIGLDMGAGKEMLAHELELDFKIWDSDSLFFDDT